MNIWDAYCNPAYYNVFFNVLKAKGMKSEDAEKLKYQYTTYIRRFKECPLASDLKKCTTPDSFREKLNEVFTVKWKNNMLFTDMPRIYGDYLIFLESMQALHNDFISPEEKKRLIGSNMDFPIPSLTPYELNYLKDGKLVALMNPLLLSILREFIEEEGIAPHRVTLTCLSFYGDLLPEMESQDYAKLLKKLWHTNRKVKKGGEHNQFKITYPDGQVKTLSTTQALKDIVMYFGFSECAKLKIMLQGKPLLVKNVLRGQEGIYEEIDSGKFMNNRGQTQDRLNIIRRINIHFGQKLKIELV